MMDIAEKFQKLGVVPVVVLEDTKDAVPLAKALVEGGLPCAEVTFRTEAAEESIRLMAEQFPDMLVGAGTVLTKEQVDAAAAAGARFIVSPGFDPEIVDYCLKKKSLFTRDVFHHLRLLRQLKEDLSLCRQAESMQKILKSIFPASIRK